jgi:hypothetical protein
MVLMRSAATVEQLQEEIQGVRYREATTTFCRLVTEAQHPLKSTIRQAIAAAAPYVQVPSHLMRLPNGELRGVNYDHTILGWRGAISLMRELRDERGVLPSVQAMWYVPQGLNVWEQVICQFPGHYARDAEQCNRQFPGADETVNRFDGPAWNPDIRTTDRTSVGVARRCHHGGSGGGVRRAWHAMDGRHQCAFTGRGCAASQRDTASRRIAAGSVRNGVKWSALQSEI